MIPVIVSKLKLFKIKRESFFRYSMELYKSFFCIAPKALKSVNVYLASSKALSMVNLKVPVSAKHKGVIDSKFVSIYNRTTLDLLYGHIKDCISTDIRDNLYLDNTISLEDTKDRNLVFGTPTTWSFAPTTKIGLIRLYFTFKEFLFFLIGKYSSSYDGSSPQGSRIGYIYLLGNPSCREFQFKEFNYPQPLKRADFKSCYPATSKIREPITTSLTAISMVWYSIYSSCLARYAKFLMIFPTRVYKIPFCFTFSLY